MIRINSVITQLILPVSALVGKPASFIAALYFASSQPLISTSPNLVVTPGSATSTDWNDTPCLVRKSLALSHSVNFDHGPTKTWKLQPPAVTVIGVFAEAASRSGFTKWVSPRNNGR